MTIGKLGGRCISDRSRKVANVRGRSEEPGRPRTLRSKMHSVADYPEEIKESNRMNVSWFDQRCIRGILVLFGEVLYFSSLRSWKLHREGMGLALGWNARAS